MKTKDNSVGNIIWNIIKQLLTLAWRLFLLLLRLVLKLAETLLHHLNDFLKKINS